MTQGPPPDWRLHEHETLASTQDVALEAARAGDPGRLAVLAAAQTAGRGSRGRGWLAPAGNLNLSVLLRPQPGPLDPGRWALLAAVALHAALSPYADRLMLKWPNDVLLGGAKLAGILIDCQPGDAAFVVIGMGANLAAAPPVEGRRTAHLPQPAPAARDVAHSVVEALDAWATRDTPGLIDAWLARAHPIGTWLDVQTPQRRVRGAFAGLTPAGALRLEGEAAAIASAEVFLS